MNNKGISVVEFLLILLCLLIILSIAGKITIH